MTPCTQTTSSNAGGWDVFVAIPSNVSVVFSTQSRGSKGTILYKLTSYLSDSSSALGRLPITHPLVPVVQHWTPDKGHPDPTRLCMLLLCIAFLA